MTYWIVMYQIDPIPLGAPGPIKLSVNRKNYEVAMQDMNATIDCSKGKFVVTGNKRAFTAEGGMEIYLVVDVKKIPK